MKSRYGVALLGLLALPLLAESARADDPFAPGLPFRVECGANAYFRVYNRQNGWGCQLGPWYSYWPMEAHYQTPALPSYPFWPAPQAVVPGGTSSAIPAPFCPPAIPTAAPAAAAPQAPANAVPAYYRQMGYNPYGYYAYPRGAQWQYGR
jgi:hypothetical protein